jgi:hypothetical protein
LDGFGAIPNIGLIASKRTSRIKRDNHEDATIFATSKGDQPPPGAAITVGRVSNEPSREKLLALKTKGKNRKIALGISRFSDSPGSARAIA